MAFPVLQMGLYSPATQLCETEGKVGHKSSSVDVGAIIQQLKFHS